MKWKAQTFFFFFLICIFLLPLFRFAPSFFFYHQTLVTSTQNQCQVFFFFLFQLVSITQALAGRHYPSPMWSVWHVAASLPFIWFVNFFKLIWFFFCLIWLLLYTVKSHQFSQIFTYCLCTVNVNVTVD